MVQLASYLVGQMAVMEDRCELDVWSGPYKDASLAPLFASLAGQLRGAFATTVSEYCAR